MKNWKKGILGVALSFMFLFTCVGYAALTDTLSISGTVSATMPEEIFISEIKLASGNGSASITGLTQITVTEAGMFEITVCNNTSNKYVYTGSNPAVTAAETENGASIGTVRETTDAYVAGTNLKQIAPKTANGPTCVKMYVTYDSAGVIDFNFKAFIYKISYINNGSELDARYVFDNSEAVSTENEAAKTKAEEGMEDENAELGYWMNSGNSQVDEIPAGYPEEDDPTEIVLYPKFNSPYTAMFVNQDGSLLAWCFFNNVETSKYYYKNTVAGVDGAEVKATNALQAILSDDLKLDHWQVVGDGINQEFNIDNFAGYVTDVTIYPYFKYQGDVSLIPVDEDNDGDIEYYQVGGYNNPDAPTNLVEIPAEVNGIPVTEINESAFAIYDDLHAVRIPDTIETINTAVFSDSTSDRQTVTLYFDGDSDLWARYMDIFYANKSYSYYTDYNTLTTKYTEVTQSIFVNGWDSGMGVGSRIFFLTQDENGNAKTNQDDGYWELYRFYGQNGVTSTIFGNVPTYGYIYVWIYHDHSFPYDSTQHSCNYEHNQNDTDYDGACTCNTCNGNTRPDAEYWTGVTTTTLE